MEIPLPGFISVESICKGGENAKSVGGAGEEERFDTVISKSCNNTICRILMLYMRMKIVTGGGFFTLGRN